MKIIAATDFSRAANNAVRSALKLARKYGDSVIVVRVVEPVVEVHPELRIPDAGVFDAAIRQAAESELSRLVSDLPNEGVLVEGQTLVGSPARVLSTLAADVKARLIVLGAGGKSSAARLFLGSVAERTVLEASCPVLVVPEGAAPFDRWVNGQALRTLVGFELDAASEAVLDEIKGLRGAGPCDVSLVHTYWPPAEYARLGLRGPRHMFTEDPEVVQVLERELRSRAELNGGPGATTLRIQSAWGRLGDTLAKDAVAEQSDLVIVGTRQPHGWSRIEGGSVAIGALRAAQTAVLCVPARPSLATANPPPIPLLRSILVPTDLSDLGNAAVAHACSLLRSSGGVLELVHVREQHLPSPLAYDTPVAPLAPQERAELEARLARLVPPGALALGISAHVTIIDGGLAAEAILQAARRLGVDAIAISSHGRSGMRRAFLGSVAEAVMRGYDKPVYVVRGK